MIESKINGSNDGGYPKLMEHEYTTGLIAIFYNETTCAVLKLGNNENDVLKIFNDWDISNFKPFNDEIVLKHK
jgi:hypothetical protein